MIILKILKVCFCHPRQARLAELFWGSKSFQYSCKVSSPLFDKTAQGGEISIEAESPS